MSKLIGYTKASTSVIASEADPEYWVTTLRCPRNGWTFRVVWHCPVETWINPWEYIKGYAIKTRQVKDL